MLCVRVGTLFHVTHESNACQEKLGEEFKLGNIKAEAKRLRKHCYAKRLRKKKTRYTCQWPIYTVLILGAIKSKYKFAHRSGFATVHKSFCCPSTGAIGVKR